VEKRVAALEIDVAVWSAGEKKSNGITSWRRREHRALTLLELVAGHFDVVLGGGAGGGGVEEVVGERDGSGIEGEGCR
jgi:hypothetical protein